MNLLSPILYLAVGSLYTCLYFGVGFGEWFLCVLRTRAIAENKVKIAVSVVFIENGLSLWVLSNFVRNNDIWLAFAYCLGGSIGAYTVCRKIKK